ncbi:MAG: preprotein translocase subunit SecF [Actinomycetota bacterium]|jgi:preprotein translocase subunit SecF|nr:preprotein translocase subunit SecF [Actinomycetota bacterium]
MYHGETKVDFVGKRKLWFLISGIVILISLGSLLFRTVPSDCASFPVIGHGLRCGIEFNGGVQLRADVPASGPLGHATDLQVVSKLQDAMSSFGSATVQVGHQAASRSALVQTGVLPTAQQNAARAAVAKATGAPLDSVSFTSIGGSWGSDVSSKAIRALVIFLLVIVAFISWRFEWKMALAALVALFHDLIVTAGVYSLAGFEVTPSTIVAILTILGYSLYDTVVVFDKLEENTAMYATTGRMTYQDSANLAMNQVFMRSLNTSLATLLPVTALLVVGAGLLGAGTLKDLALALLVGILSGTYSSIFVATPLLSVLKEREPRYRNIREKVLRDAKRGGVPAPVGAVAVGAADRAEVQPAGVASPATTMPRRTGPARPSSKSRAGSKKAKRRKKR